MYICVCVKQKPDSASVYVDPITGQVDYERFVQVLNQAMPAQSKQQYASKRRYIVGATLAVALELPILAVALAMVTLMVSPVLVTMAVPLKYSRSVPKMRRVR